MKDFATKYLNWYDKQSKVVRALLCVLWDVPSTLRRFSVSALKDDTLGMVLAVVLGIFGGMIMFLIDLVTILAMDKILWLSDLGVENMTESLSGDGKKVRFHFTVLKANHLTCRRYPGFIFPKSSRKTRFHAKKLSCTELSKFCRDDAQALRRIVSAAGVSGATRF